MNDAQYTFYSTYLAKLLKKGKAISVLSLGSRYFTWSSLTYECTHTVSYPV